MKRLAATLSPVSLGVGATNWQAPSFNPDLGMFYVGTSRTYAMYYLTDTDDHPEGWGGLDAAAGSDGNALLALDYRTGKAVWRHEWPSGSGITNNLSTPGRVLFTSNGSNLIAFDGANGKILWHSTLIAAPQRGTDHLSSGWAPVSVGRGGRRCLRFPNQRALEVGPATCPFRAQN